MNKKVFIVRIITALALMIVLASPLLASGGEEGVTGGQLKEFAWKLANTGILFYLLFRFAVKPLVKAIKNKKSEVKETLEQARTAKEKAEEKYNEYQNRIANLDEEIKIIVETLKDEGEIEKKKIIETANKLAEEIVANAKSFAEVEIKKAKIELKNEAILLSVKLAEEIVKREIKEDDHERIVKEYIEKLGVRT